MTRGEDISLLLVRAHSLTCAFPVEAVSEITRALPLRVLAGGPAYLRGASLIRGQPTPVIDLAVLLGGDALARPARYVVLRASSPVALAVDAVTGVRVESRAALGALPRLLTHAGGEHVRSLLSLDGDLVPVIASAVVLPAEVLNELRAEPAGETLAVGGGRA
jgi:purine-binding chemotaxis protein CheW